MTLAELPKSSKIYAEGISDGSKYLTFKHLDGMYSYCETEKGNPIHLYFGTPLREKGDGYEICDDA